jgi:hypothetical protein
MHTSVSMFSLSLFASFGFDRCTELRRVILILFVLFNNVLLNTDDANNVLLSSILDKDDANTVYLFFPVITNAICSHFQFLVIFSYYRRFCADTR